MFGLEMLDGGLATGGVGREGLSPDRVEVGGFSAGKIAVSGLTMEGVRLGISWFEDGLGLSVGGAGVDGVSTGVVGV